MKLTAQLQVGCVYREHTRLQVYYAEERWRFLINHCLLIIYIYMPYVMVLWGACDGALWRLLAFERSCLKLLFGISCHFYYDEKSKWSLVLHTKKDGRCLLCAPPSFELQSCQKLQMQIRKITDTGVQGLHMSALVGAQIDQSARTLPIWLYSPPPIVSRSICL